MQTDYQALVMMDTNRRLADLQSTTDRNLGSIRSEFHLFRQETKFYLQAINSRLEALEMKANKPVIDLAAIWQSLWFRVALLAMLGASNKELLEIVSASFGK